MKILLATTNNHKKEEIQALFKGMNLEILSLQDIGFVEEIREDGITFVENSSIKAHFVYNRLGMPTLADDSGICVHALGGEPGIHSARFVSSEASSERKNQEIINRLDLQEDRSAHYTCALTFLDQNRSFVTEQYCLGTITEEPRGTSGFGYDPIFFLKEYEKTMAEIPMDVKNTISHRGKALEEFKTYIKENYGIA